MDLGDANKAENTQAPLFEVDGTPSPAQSSVEIQVKSHLAEALDEFDPPFSVVEPAHQSAPFVLSSPHSGRKYPQAFLAASRLDARAIRRSEDSYIDEIFADAPSLGLPFLCAEFPRAFLDVNREAFEFDPGMFHDPLPGFVNTRSHRVASGLGTIARVVSDGSEIYKDKLTLADAFDRVDRLHQPYHQALSTLMETTKTRFGSATLIDCHSMPSHLSAGPLSSYRKRQTADIILGNRYGTSCSPLIIDETERVLTGFGYRVVRNEPFAGGFCTEKFGRPVSGFHSLQIEINRELYMNEVTFERRKSLSDLKSHMKGLIKALTGLETRALKSPLQR